jgi:hypothetical protein
MCSWLSFCWQKIHWRSCFFLKWSVSIFLFVDHVQPSHIKLEFFEQLSNKHMILWNERNLTVERKWIASTSSCRILRLYHVV